VTSSSAAKAGERAVPERLKALPGAATRVYLGPRFLSGPVGWCTWSAKPPARHGGTYVHAIVQAVGDTSRDPPVPLSVMRQTANRPAATMTKTTCRILLFRPDIIPRGDIRPGRDADRSAAPFLAADTVSGRPSAGIRS
jgi:hypothetical protein